MQDLGQTNSDGDYFLKLDWLNLNSQITINPLTLMSDQDRISPYNIKTISTREVMRIQKTMNLGLISWSSTKFSELTLSELYGWQ